MARVFQLGSQGAHLAATKPCVELSTHTEWPGYPDRAESVNCRERSLGVEDSLESEQ